MSTKIFNTRLQLKYDSYANWSAEDKQFKLLAGEIAVVNVPAADAGAVDENAPGYNKKPAILFKVGDNEHTFNDLPWASGLAADVYEWAKKEHAEASDVTVKDTAGNFSTVESKDVESILAFLKKEIDAMGGDNGSISEQIATGIAALGSASVTGDKKYVTGVKVVDGKLLIEEKDLPDYSDVYAAKSLEKTVADHLAAVANYDTRITAAQNQADKGVADAAAANANADTRVKTADFETFKTDNTKAIEDAQKTADDAATAISDLDKKVGAIPADATATTVAAYAKEVADAATEVANEKVASVSAADASITIGGEATAPTVGVKVSVDADNALALTENGLKVTIPAAAEYEIRKETTAEEGYAATYKLLKDGTPAGASINIPKDMVVSSGSVVELAEGEVEDLSAGTYIKLVLANANNETLYIPVGSLIEYVTSGSATGDMVVIAIDDDHKVTATITDGTITLAKLKTDIQTEINWVTNHKATIESMESKVSAWDAAEGNAKDYADSLIAGLDGDATATAEADGKVSVLTGIAQADGVISKASEVTLEKVAKTGKLGDLVEDTVADKDTTDYVVFYCGTSEILTK